MSPGRVVFLVPPHVARTWCTCERCVSVRFRAEVMHEGRCTWCAQEGPVEWTGPLTPGSSVYAVRCASCAQPSLFSSPQWEAPRASLPPESAPGLRPLEVDRVGGAGPVASEVAPDGAGLGQQLVLAGVDAESGQGRTLAPARASNARGAARCTDRCCPPAVGTAGTVQPASRASGART